MKTVYLLPVLVFGLALSACAPSTIASTAPTAQSEAASTQPVPLTPTAPPSQPSPVAQAQQAPAGTSGNLARTDAQGAVQFEVTPLNLTTPGETLDFEVRMNTHSVDLGVNLAELATLSTDNGQQVTAQKWEAPGGGHHVAGKLVVPSTVNGKPLLQGATQVTVSLRNIDARERVFTWGLK